jgi:hypothetical protein
MYFYNESGKKQIVDFTGDFILTHNTGLLTARFPSAAPKGAKNARYIVGVHSLSFIGKCKAVYASIRFIWGPNTSLAPEQIEERNAGS